MSTTLTNMAKTKKVATEATKENEVINEVESVQTSNEVTETVQTLDEQLQAALAMSEWLKERRTTIDLTNDEAFDALIADIKANKDDIKRIESLKVIEEKKQQQHEAYLAKVGPFNNAIDDLLIASVNGEGEDVIDAKRQALVDMFAPKTAQRSTSTRPTGNAGGPSKTQQILDIITPMYASGSTPAQVRAFFRESGVVDNSGVPFVDGTYNAVIKAFERDNGISE